MNQKNITILSLIFIGIIPILWHEFDPILTIIISLILYFGIKKTNALIKKELAGKDSEIKKGRI